MSIPSISAMNSDQDQELTNLHARYKDRITLRAAQSLNRQGYNLLNRIQYVTLPYNTLVHFFKPETGGNTPLKGFHYLAVDQKPAIWVSKNFGPGVQAGYIALKPTDSIEFKTVFDASVVSKERVLEYLKESLQNIHAAFTTGNAVAFIGATENGITIKTVIDPTTHEITSFYPTTSASEKEKERLFERALSTKPYTQPAKDRAIIAINKEDFMKSIPDKVIFDSKMTPQGNKNHPKQALQNITAVSTLPGNKLSIEGLADNGMLIRVIIDRTNNTIMKFYPII